jgi:DNA invertase Pin-like site-specific DNA recombinase
MLGYARISTGEQTLALQQDALESAGCDRVFTDIVSGDLPGNLLPVSHKRQA